MPSARPGTGHMACVLEAAIAYGLLGLARAGAGHGILLPCPLKLKLLGLRMPHSEQLQLERARANFNLRGLGLRMPHSCLTRRMPHSCLTSASHAFLPYKRKLLSLASSCPALAMLRAGHGLSE